jgi:hypothetical protein
MDLNTLLQCFSGFDEIALKLEMNQDAALTKDNLKALASLTLPLLLMNYNEDIMEDTRKIFRVIHGLDENVVFSDTFRREMLMILRLASNLVFSGSLDNAGGNASFAVRQ